MKRVRRLVIALVAVLVASAFISMMVMVIYPGSFKLTAPVLCPDDLPDAMVVEYSVETTDGEGINFTMFCIGERGVFTEIGTWQPYLLLTVFTAGALIALIIVLAVVRMVGVSLGISGDGPQSGGPAPTSGSSPPPSPPTPKDASPLIS